MSKTIKLQEEELQNIKGAQTKITQLIYGLGQLEVQKTNVLTQLEEAQLEQNKLGKELQEKYGEGNINLETGEITLTEKPESTE
jgi:ribosomal protein S3AE